jgi:NADH-quinone oxidoreductase subunit I
VRFLGIRRAWAAVIANARRAPWTVQYPAVQRDRAERYRSSSFALLHDEHGEEACVACLLCEKICPSAVITIDASPKRESPVTGKKRQYLQDFTLDLNACLYCELCVQVCPTDAIVMVKVPQPPVEAREDLLLTMERLYANEAAPRSWGNGTKLQEMQEMPKDKGEKGAA